MLKRTNSKAYNQIKNNNNKKDLLELKLEDNKYSHNEQLSEMNLGNKLKCNTRISVNLNAYNNYSSIKVKTMIKIK